MKLLSARFGDLRYGDDTQEHPEIIDKKVLKNGLNKALKGYFGSPEECD